MIKASVWSVCSSPWVGGRPPLEEVPGRRASKISKGQHGEFKNREECQTNL